MVKEIYHYFRSVCVSPSFTWADWLLLYHWDNMDDWKNLEKGGEIAGEGKKKALVSQSL